MGVPGGTQEPLPLLRPPDWDKVYCGGPSEVVAGCLPDEVGRTEGLESVGLTPSVVVTPVGVRDPEDVVVETSGVADVDVTTSHLLDGVWTDEGPGSVSRVLGSGV